MDRGEIAKVWAASRRLRVGAGDDLHAEHPPELLALTRRADHATDGVALSQADASDHWRRNVDIVGARQQAAASNEAVAVVDDLEDPLGPDLPMLFRLRGEDALNGAGELLLLGDGDADVLRRGDQLWCGHVREDREGEKSLSGEVGLGEDLNVDCGGALWWAHHDVRIAAWSAGASGTAIAHVIHGCVHLPAWGVSNPLSNRPTPAARCAWGDARTLRDPRRVVNAPGRRRAGRYVSATCRPSPSTSRP